MSATLSEREQQIVLLAEKVMGWRVYGEPYSVRKYGPGMWIYTGPNETGGALHLDEKHGTGWKPFTNISDAWMLVEKLTEKYAVSVGSYHPGWRIGIMQHGTCQNLAQEIKATAQEAICAAALAIVEGK